MRKPVVCFKSATGVAEYLAQDPVASLGIVPFLDVEAAASRIFRFIEDSDFRVQVGQASKKLAKSRFSLERYVAEIERNRASVRIEEATGEGGSTGHFSIESLRCALFFLSPRSAGSSDPIRHYISAYSSGIRPRKAVPGFHPGVYEERNDTRGVIPWRIIWLTGGPRDRGSLTSFAAHRDFPGAVQSLQGRTPSASYYHEMGKEIFEHLRGIKSRIDLLISVTSRPAAEAVQRLFPATPRGQSTSGYLKTAVGISGHF